MVVLSWKAPISSKKVSSYRVGVCMGISYKEGTQIASLDDLTARSATVGKLSNGLWYSFQVRAVYEDGSVSAPSPTAVAKPEAGAGAASSLSWAPLVAAKQSGDSIVVSWSDTGAGSYAVYRGAAGASAVTKASYAERVVVKGTQASFAGFFDGERYAFAVAPLQGSVEGGLSSLATAAFDATPSKASIAEIAAPATGPCRRASLAYDPARKGRLVLVWIGRDDGRLRAMASDSGGPWREIPTGHDPKATGPALEFARSGAGVLFSTGSDPQGKGAKAWYLELAIDAAPKPTLVHDAEGYLIYLSAARGGSLFGFGVDANGAKAGGVEAWAYAPASGSAAARKYRFGDTSSLVYLASHAIGLDTAGKAYYLYEDSRWDGASSDIGILYEGDGERRLVSSKSDAGHGNAMDAALAYGGAWQLFYLAEDGSGRLDVMRKAASSHAGLLAASPERLNSSSRALAPSLAQGRTGCIRVAPLSSGIWIAWTSADGKARGLKLDGQAKGRPGLELDLGQGIIDSLEPSASGKGALACVRDPLSGGLTLFEWR
jgi:hypothetical protein